MRQPPIPPAEPLNPVGAGESLAIGGNARPQRTALVTQKEALSFDRVYSEWFHEVRRWTRAFGGLDADTEDLAQEVFVVVGRKLDSFDGRNLPGWLYSITRRTVRDYRRAVWLARFWKKSEPIDTVSPHFQAAASIEDMRDEMDQRQALRDLTLVLERMKGSHRVVFTLFEVEGYSGQEIAALEGIKLATVWSRLHQARAAFSKTVDALRAEGLLE